MECLDHIIGITNSECECVLAGLTEEQVQIMRTSKSGLYLDAHLDGGVSLQDIKLLENCGEYYALATRAIATAQKTFYDELQIVISQKYKSIKPRFIGELGRLQYAGAMNVQNPLQYLHIKPIAQSSAVFKVNNVRLNINSSREEVAVKLVEVYEGLNYGETVFETTVNAQANKFVSVEIPVNLKLPFTKNGRKVEYYFVWERVEGECPMDNGVSCGCSGGDAYDGYILLSGGTATDYEHLGKREDKFAHGFSVDAEIFCETGSLVCNEYNSQDAFALVTAWAVLYKAGQYLIEYVLQSPEINRFTMMSRDYLYGKRNRFAKEYETRLAYLGSELELTASDCFSCNNKRMFVGNVYG